jgi:mannose-1-phosphate guanylyltransferase/mannose-6-phosphate isomerase
MVIEPTPRDTGPAVGLACAAVANRDPCAIAAIFPTDHVIEDDPEFIRSVRAAAAAAGRGALVCLGVKPDRPATGFGYLKCATKPVRGRSVGVARFVEKPSLNRARKFLESGSYLWNAGMFIWKVDRFMKELDRTAPAIGRAVRATLAGNKRAWTRASRLSVDYAVMEKARDVRVVPLDAGWDDIGSWDAAARMRGNADRARARRIMVNSPGSEVFGDTRMVALVDAPDMIVVDTPDALLVVSRKSSENVRAVVEQLRRRGRKDLL